VLTLIDGERDLRGIAASLGRDEFETAKIAYGLATTGIIGLRQPMRTTMEYRVADAEERLAAARAFTRRGEHALAVEELRRAMQEDPLVAAVHFDLGFAAARAGDFATARASWEHFLRVAAEGKETARAREALYALGAFEHILEEDAHG